MNEPDIESVRVGHRRYRVVSAPNGSPEDSERLGECSHRYGEIRVSSGLTPEGRVEVLLHEILHALFRDSGLDWTDVTEERVVEHLSPRVAAFLVDNPKEVQRMVDVLSNALHPRCPDA